MSPVVRFFFHTSRDGSANELNNLDCIYQLATNRFVSYLVYKQLQLTEPTDVAVPSVPETVSASNY